MTTRTSFRVLAAVIIAAATLTCALEGAAAQSAQQVPTAAEQSAIDHVAAFGQAATEEDAVPGETVLTGRVRRVGARSARRRVWASIAPTQDCVQVGEEGASACGAPERLEHEPLIVGSSRGRSLNLSDAQPPAPEEFAGLAENGTEAVEVTYSNGEAESVAVIDNGFYVNAEGREVEAFHWTADGTVHTYQEG